MNKHRLVIDTKTSCTEPDSPASPCFAGVSKTGNGHHHRWALVGIAAAMFVSVTIMVLKGPTVAGASRQQSGTGTTSPCEKTAGPHGIQTNIIFKANNVVYAGTETQGVYISTDNGLSWVPANAGIERASISDIIASGPNLLAAAKSSCPTYLNVFKSTDNGATWSGTSGLVGSVVHSFVTKGTSVIVYGLYSTDFGETWGSGTPGFCPPFGCGIATYTLEGNSIFGGNTAGMFLSTDRGASWTDINQGFATCPIPVVEASCVDELYLFAGTFGEAVWRKLLRSNANADSKSNRNCEPKSDGHSQCQPVSYLFPKCNAAAYSNTEAEPVTAASAHAAAAAIDTSVIIQTASFSLLGEGVIFRVTDSRIPHSTRRTYARR
jgi:hypothetical protein